MTHATHKSVVLGLGASGVSCARHLLAQGHDVCAMDSRQDPPGLAATRVALPGLEIRTGGWDEARALTAPLLAVSPGIAADHPLLERARGAGVDVAGDIELFARAATAPATGITGTNGKSTVTSLLGAILRAAGLDVAVGGNLGTPALDLLPQAPTDGYVLELSSFQLDLVTRIDLRCAAILNVSEDHLDRYGSMHAYGRSKRRIYEHARAAVYNLDDAATHPDAAFAGHRVGLRAEGVPAGDEWGLRDDADGRCWLTGPDGPFMPADQLPIAGRHNAFNAVAAVAMAHVLGVAPSVAVTALRAFEPLPHRCVPVASVAGVQYIDDSKATNVGACIAALEGVGGGRRRLVLIAGGLGKDADFSVLREAVAANVTHMVLIGRDAPLLASALEGLCPLEFAVDMDAAVRAAAGVARAGEVVLLAPACASFDMFASFGARGDAFGAAVAGLAGEVSA